MKKYFLLIPLLTFIYPSLSWGIVNPWWNLFNKPNKEKVEKIEKADKSVIAKNVNKTSKQPAHSPKYKKLDQSKLKKFNQMVSKKVMSNGKFIKQKVPYTPEQQAAVDYDLALRSLQNGDQAAASVCLHRVLDQTPNNINARLQLVNYYRSIGDNNKVEQLLQHGLGLNSKEPVYIKQMALLLNNKDEYGKALTLLLTMPKASQDDVEYKQLLALTYFHEGFFDLAQKYYIQLLRLEPNNSNWRLGLAVAQDAAGEHQKAAENFARARHYGGLDSETIKYIQQCINNLQQDSSDPMRSS